VKTTTTTAPPLATPIKTTTTTTTTPSVMPDAPRRTARAGRGRHGLGVYGIHYPVIPVHYGYWTRARVVAELHRHGIYW
jgi:hypothetical protein